MLRLTLDIVPFGDESRTRTLATVTIANVTEGDTPDGTPCDYEVHGERHHEGNAFLAPTTYVRGFTRGRHATELAAAALHALGWDGEG